MSFWSKLGSSIGSALFNNDIGAGLMSFFGFENAKDERLSEQQYNSMEAEKNRQFQREMWEKTNEYNSPQAQLERLMQAGINPNALFGGSNPSVASSAPSGSQAAPTPSIANSLLLHDAQIANLMAQSRKTDSETNLNQQTFDWNKMTEKQRYDALVNANEESRKRIDKLISDRNIQEQAFAWAAKLNEEELKIKFEQANVLRTQWLSTFKSIEKTEQDIKESQARVDLLKAQTAGQEIQNDISRVEKEFSVGMGLPLNTPLEQALFGLFKSGKLNDFYSYLITSHSNGAYVDTRSQMELRNIMNKINDENDKINAPAYTYQNVNGYSVYNPAGVHRMPNGMTKREYQFSFFDAYRNAKTKSEKYRIRKRFNQIFGPDDWPNGL